MFSLFHRLEGAGICKTTKSHACGHSLQRTTGCVMEVGCYCLYVSFVAVAHPEKIYKSNGPCKTKSFAISSSIVHLKMAGHERCDTLVLEDHSDAQDVSERL